MQLKFGNILNQMPPCAVTTNGFGTKNVMGMGIARQVKLRYPEFPELLGDAIKTNGNIFQHIQEGWYAFPVKPVEKVITNINEVVPHMRGNYKVGDWVPGFHCMADLDIIKRSCVQLMKELDNYEIDKIHIPRPGCGAGGLDFLDILWDLERLLDDRVHVWTFKAEKGTVWIQGVNQTELSDAKKRKIDEVIISGKKVCLLGETELDERLQDYLRRWNHLDIVVYHNGSEPRYNLRYPSVSVTGDLDAHMSTVATERLLL